MKLRVLLFLIVACILTTHYDPLYAQEQKSVQDMLIGKKWILKTPPNFGYNNKQDNLIFTKNRMCYVVTFISTPTTVATFPSSYYLSDDIDDVFNERNVGEKVNGKFITNPSGTSIIKEITEFKLVLLNYTPDQDYTSGPQTWIVSPENEFGLEPFIDHKSYLYGYKKGENIIIPAKYRYISDFTSKGIARVMKTDNKAILEDSTMCLGGGLYGFIDTLGRVVIPMEFELLGPLEQYEVVEFSKKTRRYWFLPTKRRTKYGLINDKGEILLKPIYDEIRPITQYLYGEHTGFKAWNFKDGKVDYTNPIFLDLEGNKVSPEDM